MYIIDYVVNVYVTIPANFPIGAQVTGKSYATSSYLMPAIRAHTFPIHSVHSVLIRGLKYVRVTTDKVRIWFEPPGRSMVTCDLRVSVCVFVFWYAFAISGI